MFIPRNLSVLRKVISFFVFLPMLCFATDLSLAAIFQNEAPYLKEWIEFHKIQGAGHFYLYNHQSTDHYLDVLKPYIDQGEVTLIDWPYGYEYGDSKAWRLIKSAAYDHAIRSHRDKTRWLAFLDIDEFLFCPNGQNLVSMLYQYKTAPALAVSQMLFGTSKKAELEEGDLVTESFTASAPADHPLHKRVKFIVQLRHTAGCSDPSFFHYQGRKFAVNANRQKVHKDSSETILHDKICINHYWTKDERYFSDTKMERIKRMGKQDTFKDLLLLKDSCNGAKNTGIQKFVPVLKSNCLS